MNENETNAAIAPLLGYEARREVQYPYRRVFWKDGRHFVCDEDCCDLPAWNTDYNTRPEMLAALTTEQKVALCRELGMGLDAIREKGWIRLLELTQPEFARLWLAVKGRAIIGKAEK